MITSAFYTSPFLVLSTRCIQVSWSWGLENPVLGSLDRGVEFDVRSICFEISEEWIFSVELADMIFMTLLLTFETASIPFSCSNLKLEIVSWKEMNRVQRYCQAVPVGRLTRDVSPNRLFIDGSRYARARIVDMIQLRRSSSPRCQLKPPYAHHLHADMQVAMTSHGLLM